MTSLSSPGRPDSRDRSAQLSTLGEQLPRFARLVHAVKVQQTEGRERAALVLLYPLVRMGPVRQGALAELMHTDPSTVSRHVGSLVERGLVKRVADETDGRASRLVVTDAGHEALDQLRRERESYLERVTADWSDEDLTMLGALLQRLLDDLARTLPGQADCSDAPGTARPAS